MAEITTPIDFARIIRQNDCAKNYSSENPRKYYQTNNNYSTNNHSSYNPTGGNYQ